MKIKVMSIFYFHYITTLSADLNKNEYVITPTTAVQQKNVTQSTSVANTTSDTWSKHIAWTPQSFPNPQKDVDRCGRRGKGSYICDPDNVVVYEDANILDQMIVSIREESSCPCTECPQNQDGYMFSLAVLSKTEVEEEEVDKKELQKFADELRKIWNFGHCENDVLILLVPDVKDKMVYSSVGKKAEEILTSECSQKFYDRAHHYFKGEVYALGLESMLKDYGSNTIKGQCHNTWVHGTTAGIVLGSLFGIIVIVSVIFMIIECIRRRYHEIRRKKKFHYALSYSSAAVAQRRFPTSHSWSAFGSNVHNSYPIPGATSTRNLVTSGFAGLSGRMKMHHSVSVSEDKEGLTPNKDGENGANV